MADTNINTFANIAKVEAIAPTTLNGLPGMSSLEIAEITGKNHKHVLRDIAKMLTELELINESKSGPVNARRWAFINTVFLFALCAIDQSPSWGLCAGLWERTQRANKRKT